MPDPRSRSRSLPADLFGAAPITYAIRQDIDYMPPPPLPQPHYIMPLATTLHRLRPLTGAEHFLVPKSKSMEVLLGLSPSPTGTHGTCSSSAAVDGAFAGQGARWSSPDPHGRVGPAARGAPAADHLLSPVARTTGARVYAPGQVAQSRIPPADHIRERAPLPSNIRKSERNAAAQQWGTTIFPSETPAGREQVHLLRQWIAGSVAALHTERAARGGIAVEGRFSGRHGIGPSGIGPSGMAPSGIVHSGSGPSGSGHSLADGRHVAVGHVQGRGEASEYVAAEPKAQAAVEGRHGLQAGSSATLERRARRAMALLGVYDIAVHEIVRQVRTRVYIYVCICIYAYIYIYIYTYIYIHAYINK